MLDLALAAVLLVALGAILFGVRYMRREAFLPYHADVVGKSWGELDAGVQVIILGMLKIIGAGFATLGVTLLWLCFALHEGARWAPWAILTVSAGGLGAHLVVCPQPRAVRPRPRTAARAAAGGMALRCVSVRRALLCPGIGASLVLGWQAAAR